MLSTSHGRRPNSDDKVQDPWDQSQEALKKSATANGKGVGK